MKPPPSPSFEATISGDDDFDAEWILELYMDEGCGDEMIELRVWLHSDTLEHPLDGAVLGSPGEEFWMNRVSSIGPHDREGGSDRRESFMERTTPLRLVLDRFLGEDPPDRSRGE